MAFNPPEDAAASALAESEELLRTVKTALAVAASERDEAEHRANQLRKALTSALQHLCDVEAAAQDRTLRLARALALTERDRARRAAGEALLAHNRSLIGTLSALVTDLEPEPPPAAGGSEPWAASPAVPPHAAVLARFSASGPLAVLPRSATAAPGRLRLGGGSSAADAAPGGDGGAAADDVSDDDGDCDAAATADDDSEFTASTVAAAVAGSVHRATSSGPASFFGALGLFSKRSGRASSEADAAQAQQPPSGSASRRGRGGSDAPADAAPTHAPPPLPTGAPSSAAASGGSESESSLPLSTWLNAPATALATSAPGAASGSGSGGSSFEADVTASVGVVMGAAATSPSGPGLDAAGGAPPSATTRSSPLVLAVPVAPQPPAAAMSTGHSGGGGFTRLEALAAQAAVDQAREDAADGVGSSSSGGGGGSGELAGVPLAVTLVARLARTRAAARRALGAPKATGWCWGGMTAAPEPPRGDGGGTYAAANVSSGSSDDAPAGADAPASAAPTPPLPRAHARLLAHVFSFLTHADLAVASGVCRTWHALPLRADLLVHRAYARCAAVSPSLRGGLWAAIATSVRSSRGCPSPAAPLFHALPRPLALELEPPSTAPPDHSGSDARLQGDGATSAGAQLALLLLPPGPGGAPFRLDGLLAAVLEPQRATSGGRDADDGRSATAALLQRLLCGPPDADDGASGDDAPGTATSSRLSRHGSGDSGVDDAPVSGDPSLRPGSHPAAMRRARRRAADPVAAHARRLFNAYLAAAAANARAADAVSALRVAAARLAAARGEAARQLSVIHVAVDSESIWEPEQSEVFADALDALAQREAAVAAAHAAALVGIRAAWELTAVADACGAAACADDDRGSGSSSSGGDDAGGGGAGRAFLVPARRRWLRQRTAAGAGAGGGVGGGGDGAGCSGSRDDGDAPAALAAGDDYATAVADASGYLAAASAAASAAAAASGGGGGGAGGGGGGGGSVPVRPPVPSTASVVVVELGPVAGGASVATDAMPSAGDARNAGLPLAPTAVGAAALLVLPRLPWESQHAVIAADVARSFGDVERLLQLGTPPAANTTSPAAAVAAAGAVSAGAAGAAAADASPPPPPSPGPPPPCAGDAFPTTLLAAPRARVTPRTLGVLRARLVGALLAWSAYDRGVGAGYVQGMHALAGMALRHVHAHSAWALLGALLHARRYDLASVYAPGLPGLHLRLGQLEVLTGAYAPRLAAHLASVGVGASDYATGWLMTLFCSGDALPTPLAGPLLGAFLLGGWKAVLRGALVTLRAVAPDLLVHTGGAGGRGGGGGGGDYASVLQYLHTISASRLPPTAGALLRRCARLKVTQRLLDAISGGGGEGGDGDGDGEGGRRA